MFYVVWISDTQIIYVKYNTRIVWFLTQDVCYFTQNLCIMSIMNKVLCNSCVVNNNCTKMNITQFLTYILCVNQ